METKKVVTCSYPISFIDSPTNINIIILYFVLLFCFVLFCFVLFCVYVCVCVCVCGASGYQRPTW